MWAGGRDGPPRLFGCHAVMIARARAPGRFGHGGPCLSVTGAVHMKLMRAECAIQGARLCGSINPRGGRRGGDWGCRGGDVGRSRKEEEAGLLHLEVSDYSPRRHVFARQEFDFSSSRSQGGAYRAPSRARQGVEVGHGRPYEAALVECAVGGRERGDGGE
jgi:hypothetical protein